MELSKVIEDYCFSQCKKKNDDCKECTLTSFTEYVAARRKPKAQQTPKLEKNIHKNKNGKVIQLNTEEKALITARQPATISPIVPPVTIIERKLLVVEEPVSLIIRG